MTLREFLNSDFEIQGDVRFLVYSYETEGYALDQPLKESEEQYRTMLERYGDLEVKFLYVKNDALCIEAVSD